MERTTVDTDDVSSDTTRPPAQLDGARGSMRLEWIRPGVLVCTLDGTLDAGLAPEFREVLAEMLRAPYPSVEIFWDLQDLAHYHTSIRKVAQDVLLRHLHRARSHVYATSTVVKMGVSVAALVLGNVSSLPTREAFDAALAAACDGRPIR